MAEQDQVKRALELDEESGAFVMGEDGYMRFEPSDEELKAINAWIARETDLAEQEMEPVYAEAAEDIATYKASKTSDMIDGEAAILPAPLARIAVDQYVAWTFNTITRPTPMVSMQPYFKDDYDVIVPFQNGAQAIPVKIQKSAEETAHFIETGYDYKLRESLSFVSIIRDAILDACTVKRGYAKVCWEKSEQSYFQPKIDGVFVTGEKEEVYESDGDQVKWYGVPVFNILKRAHEDDIDKAEMFQERTPVSSEEFRVRCLTGKYHLIPEEKIDTYSRMTGDVKPQAQTSMEASTQNRMSIIPKEMVDVRLVWFHRWLKFKEEYTDPMTGEMKERQTLRRVQLMGDYHAGAREFGCIYRNYRNDQRRPYAVLYQLKDPHSDSGSSTTSISKWFQRVVTHLSQAEIKNAFHANNFQYWYDPDSRVASFFQGEGKKFRPGIAVPGKRGEEWGSDRAGAEQHSLVPLLSFFKNWTREAQNMSVFETGDSVPGRTPSSTISQILQQGLQQPIMFLRLISEFVKRLILLDLETRRQFQPMGEVIPTRDEETREVIDIPFRFPTGDLARNFRISLTAADEAMAKEHEPEQLMMLLNLWQQGAQFVGQVAGPLTDANATPAQRDLFVKIVEGWQALFDKVVTMTRTDREKFNLNDAVKALAQEAEMAVQEMMNAAQSQTDAGGVQPGPTGAPDEQGLPGAGAEPTLPPDLGPAPQGMPSETGFIQ